MKKILAVSTALLILSVSVAPVFAGGAGYHASQSRARVKARALDQKSTDEWKKFRSDMDVRNRDSSNPSSGVDAKQRQR